MVHELLERREIYVPRELVFDAWTDVKHLGGWYVPGACTAERVEANPVRGGAWDVAWTDARGAQFEESGRFDELVRPERLCWSLRLSGVDLEPCESRLRLLLENLGGACRVELCHEGLADPGWQGRYAALWPQRIDALLEYFSAI
ncbi:MAG: SRPBCC domain-containing protein [Pseudomonadales bacterium]